MAEFDLPVCLADQDRIGGRDLAGFPVADRSRALARRKPRGFSPGGQAISPAFSPLIPDNTLEKDTSFVYTIRMIRTHAIPCHLPRTLADALNAASGAIYTGVLVAH